MPATRMRISTFWKIAMLLALVKLGLHFFTNTRYELHRDELLYFNMADHLSFGYVSTPPVIGWLAFLVKSLFGYSVFGIRFFPALLGGISMLFMAKIIRDLGGGLPALIIALTAFLLSPGFLLLDTLFTPNVVEQFLWLLITYVFFKMIKNQQPEYWIWIGVLLGIAFLNKYSILYVMAGFGVAILVSPQRHLFGSRYFLFALLLGTLIILPNVIWQYQHDWPVVYHLSELKRTQLVNMRYSDFLVELYSLASLATVIWLAGLVTLLFFTREKEYRALGLATAIILLLFLFSNGKAYYVLGLIPVLFAFGGYALEKYLTGRWARVNYGILSLLIPVGLLSLPYGVPLMPFQQLSDYSKKTVAVLLPPFFRWEDGKMHSMSQVFSDMTGWRELTGYVAEAYDRLSPEERSRCTIYAERNYGYAGAVHFYGKKYHLPDAITFLDSYTLWAPDTVPDGPFIYINRFPDDLTELFGRVEEIGRVDDEFFREKGLRVFLCTLPKADIPGIYRQKAREEKQKYRIGS